MGLFLDGQHALVLVELHNAEALGVLDMVAEDRGTARLGILDRLAQIAAKAVSVENIVAEDHGARVIADEILSDQKRLRQTVRMRLHRVGQPDAELSSVAEQGSKRGVSSGVEMMRMSRMPASMSVESG